MHVRYGETSLGLKLGYILDDYYITRKFLREKAAIDFMELCI